MPTQIQLRRGSTVQTSTFAGAAGEITVDTDKKVVVVHDGSSPGGVPLARENHAQSAFDAANATVTGASSAGSYANSAYSTANTAATNALSAGVYANAAFLAANSAVDTWVRNAANSASSYANGAFAAANTKFSSTGGTISGDVVVTGNLSVSGNVFQVDATNLSVEDNMIYLNANNTTANPDLGFAGNYNDGSYHHAGMFRDATDGTWKFFYNYDPEPDASPYIDTSHASFRIANITANLITDVATIRGYDPINHTNTAYTHANAAFNAANNSTDTWVRNAANAASSYANSAYAVANTGNTTATSASSYANSAYLQANTATTNAATADQRAVTSGVYANAAYGVANSASSYANGAFTQANSAFNNGTSASSYANGAFSAANAASSYANSAFAKANTGGGSGLFNSAINVATGYAITSSLANAVVFTANATIYSIYVTNIGPDVNAAVTVTADFTPTGSSANVSMFRNIPIPSRSSVEMLKKPQVVKANDIIRMQSFVNGTAASSNAHVTIVYETTTLSTFDRATALAGTGYSTLYVASGSPAVIESIKVVNQDTAFGNHAISIIWTNSSNTIQGYIAKDIILPANSTIELCEAPKYLYAGHELDIYSSYANVVSVFVSAKRTA
jgi:hypothetical protein